MGSVYFSVFVSAYKEEGINVWGVNIQNEPEYFPSNYESMHFTPEIRKISSKNIYRTSVIKRTCQLEDPYL